MYRTRVRRARLLGLLVVVAAAAAALGGQLPTSSSSTLSLPTATDALRGTVGRIQQSDEHRGPLGEADGATPEETTVFDDNVQGVANLDPDLLAALRQAATAAENDGVELYVDSGWRSPEYQEALLRQAVAKYGSEAEAARWVATPETSAHVSGDAVDVGPSGAASWLFVHGAAFGLCQIYDNEPWHFELRPGASAQGCPVRYADAAHDPRMQR